ncbi:LysE family transporter [Nonomuraea sp. CA-141351]|uniref:LysE family transporter n=1 Tax=Nonomuraea sp. CA-141351 TaxID=3239996 RepID=UPI003D922F14
MIAALVAGLLAGYGIAIPVGAVATYLVALTARTSLKTGAFAALGVATADGLYALIATLGGAALTPFVQPVVAPLRWGAALVLIALALRGTTMAIRHYRQRHRPATTDDRPISPAGAFWALLGLTMLNPLTVIYFAALVLGIQTATTVHVLEQAVFVAAAFAASASWQLLLAGSGALLGQLITGSRGRLATALTSSAVIVFLALHLLSSAI